MKRNAILLNLLLALILVISGCGKEKSAQSNTTTAAPSATTTAKPTAGATPTPASTVSAEFPVNEAFAAELAAEGIPADLARYFAAAKIESTNPAPNTFVYYLFYPNGATR